jgi:hypothetical protein
MFYFDSEFMPGSELILTMNRELFLFYTDNVLCDINCMSGSDLLLNDIHLSLSLHRRRIAYLLR